MPRKILLIITALFIFYCTGAQTLYNLKYTFKDDNGGTEYYNAFMVRNDDGTGFIRVNFTDAGTGQKYLVNMDMEESYEINDKTGAEDSSILYFFGEDPVVIAGDTSEGYDPEIYVFKQHENSEYYDPEEVISVADDSTLTSGEFTDVNLIEATELTEDYVLQFFSKDDDFYKNLFETTTRSLTKEEKQATLHLLIVANTNDPDIGSTCTLDKDRTLKTYTDLAEFMNIKLDAKTIFGDNYSKKNVESAVASIKVSSPKDIIVFYYSGHGFSKSDNYQYPYIELRSKSFENLHDNSVNIENVFTLIKAKGAKVALVVSDCCNTLPETKAAVSGDVALTRSSSLGWSMNNATQLFLPPAPVAILITAAAKGELSAGNNNYGGFFTYNFRSSLFNYLSPIQTTGNVSWTKLIEEAQQQTIKKAHNTLCNLPDGTKSRCVQHPVYAIK